LLEKHIPERPRELAALPIIRIESPMPYRGWRFNAEEAEDRLVALQPVLSLTTPESAADAARLGPAWRACCITRRFGLACGELKLFLQAMEPEPAPVHLLYTSRDLAPLKLRKLSISPRRLCVRRCCVLPPPSSVCRFSAALLSVARRGQTPPP
jgi:DNA-binding transcriptional LysR family regulator